MKAKTLQFIKGTPFINYPTEFAQINVLTMDSFPDRPAYYEVRPNGKGLYTASFWAMNRGITLDAYCLDLDKAKLKCQEHFNALISENCE